MYAAPSIFHLLPTVAGLQELVMRLPVAPTRRQLQELIESSQLRVSRFGDHAAVAIMTPDGARIGHSKLPEMSSPIDRDVRILNVSPYRVRLWGRTPSGWAGTLTHTEAGLIQRHRLDAILGLRRSPFGLIPRGRNFGDSPDMERLVLPNATFEVHRNSDWTVLNDGSIVIVEPMEGELFRYRVTRRDDKGHEHTEIVDFSPPLPFEADTVRPLRLKGTYLYIVERSGETFLWVDGKELPLDGVVECAWNSPSMEAAALLIRSSRSATGNGVYRKLILLTPISPVITGSNRMWVESQMVIAGRFEMGLGDLWWSPNGRKVVAQIKEVVRGLGEDSESRHVLVTPLGQEEEVPEGASLHSPIVDDMGRIAGYILEQGLRCTPVVYGHAQDTVDFAWNMNIDQKGQLSFNSFEEELLLRTRIFSDRL